MHILMDMGTSNTRLWLFTEDKIIAEKKVAFGAGSTKAYGKEFLYTSLRELIQSLIRENSISESDIECITVSGMAGSELGICDIPHVSLPVDVYALADSLELKIFPEITEIPFIFVPGVKHACKNALTDIMRGEETEVAGILSMTEISENVTLVLPGTHNKVIRVSPNGEITEFHTTLSGELLSMIISDSILKGQVTHSFEFSDADLLRGAAYALKNGLSAALFHIRVMEKNHADRNVLSSFLYGAVLGEDADLIKRTANGTDIYIGGNENLKKAYSVLLGDYPRVITLDNEISENAVRTGLQKIYKLYHARKTREKVLDAIEREKLIAIIRAPEKKSILKAMHAMYDGGVRLAEITFDRSGKIPKTETASLIKLLCSEFEGKMLIGAGTVTTKEDVLLAFSVGASFIISPNCNKEIITLTKKLGLVSIPAAFTPTEIADALCFGADYIKLFPANELSPGYVKAIKAPLSDAKILAVGGVNAENAGDFIKNGFCGIGVGSGIYDRALINCEDFKAITDLAAKYTSAVKSV